MGRNNKQYSKTLHQQAYDRLVSMQAFGESKRKAKLEGSIKNKIFSFNTYQTYSKHIGYFIDYLKEHHPEIATLDKARAFVPEWLKYQESRGLSAWTIQTEAKALGKLFGITPEDDDYYEPPQRHRVDVKRSRGPAKRDIHFSEANNYDFVSFCRCTGLRRSEVEAAHASDLTTKKELVNEIAYLKTQPMNIKNYNRLTVLEEIELFDVEYYIHVRSGKGGVGFAKTAGNYARSLFPFAEAAKEGFDQLIWTDASTHEFIEEAGTANLLFIIDGKLITPSVRNTVLDGVTRDTILQLARKAGIEVEERRVSVKEVIEGIENGSLTDAFAAGTAATVTPIGQISYEGKLYTLADASTRTVSAGIAKALNDIRYGLADDEFGWNWVL